MLSGFANVTMLAVLTDKALTHRYGPWGGKRNAT